jgi:hypothetical protein
MALFCNSTLLDISLKRLSTLSLKLVLTCSDPATKAAATGAMLCGIKALSTKGGISASTLSGRKLTFNQTSDISAKGVGTTNWITHIALINASTLIYITKCSSRSYSTSGPDLITVPSWSVHLLGPATST